MYCERSYTRFCQPSTIDDGFTQYLSIDEPPGFSSYHLVWNFAQWTRLGARCRLGRNAINTRSRDVIPRSQHCSETLLRSRLAAIGPLKENMTSTKPEVHNVLQCRQRRTEPQPRETCTDNLVTFGRLVLHIYVRTIVVKTLVLE